MPAESHIEKTVCKWAKDRGISNLKLNGPNDRGKADRMFMKEGKAVFIEFKAPGKKPTALQLKFLAERNDDGFAAGWSDSIPSGIAILKKAYEL